MNPSTSRRQSIPTGTSPLRIVSKHASTALFETLHALALQQRGDWGPVFTLLDAGCRDVNPKVRRRRYVRSRRPPLPRPSITQGWEAANACADACDAQDNERRDKDLALQGEKDKVKKA